jgi:hypothetical protein
MTAVLVALFVFLGVIVLLLFGAYVELGRELPCKRTSLKHKSQPRDDHSHNRKAA